MKKIANTAKVSKKTLAASNTVPSATTEPAVAASPSPVAPVTPPAVVATMTDPAVQECNALLDRVLALLGDQEPLDQNEIRRTTKMRKGGAEVVPTILALCLQHDVTKIGGLDVQEMSAELQRGDALLQVGVRGALVQKKVKESAMEAHGRTWQIAMTMYRTLQRMAKDDPELALGLQPVVAFFKSKLTKAERAEAKLAKAAAKGNASAPAVPPAVAAAPGVATGGNGAAEASAAPAAVVSGGPH